MSINSLTNAAIARRPEMVPVGTVPQGLEGIAQAASTPPSMADGAAKPEKPVGAIETTTNVLFGYIPTEVITVYVAVLAAIHKPDTEDPSSGLWVAFWVFLAATPAVLWLTFAAKVKSLGQPLPIAPRAWPKWEMFAALIAYCAWAIALPDTPFGKFDWHSPAVAGVIVLLSSTVLGLMAPLFQRPLKT